MDNNTEFKCEEFKPINLSLEDGDFVEGYFLVSGILEYVKDIPDDIDENGNILDYREGFIINVPKQRIFYNNEKLSNHIKPLKVNLVKPKQKK